jgi:hypothetical protein
MAPGMGVSALRIRAKTVRATQAFVPSSGKRAHARQGIQLLSDHVEDSLVPR